MAIAAMLGGAAMAQPSGLTRLHGDAVVEQTGTRTVITTTNGAGTNHSAFDWLAFSVPAGTTTHFLQPRADSTSINRVTGGNPSEIFGTLSSNGRLVLVNPAGIAVGDQGLVDTAGFTASTLGMTRDDAIAGRLRFGGTGALQDFGTDKSDRIRVQGQVLAKNGDVVLIGPDLEIDGGAIVEANAGDVVLAAGRTVELTGRGIEGIRMELRAPDDRAINLGTLTGDSVAIFAGQLRHRGLIQARTATVSGGRVVLEAVTDAEIDGPIAAATGMQGGSVRIAALRLVLKAAAFIDVSHPNGGGEIRLVGSERLDGDAGAVLKADTTLSGPAGIVTLDGASVDFRGTIITAGAGTGGSGTGDSSGSSSDSAGNTGGDSGTGTGTASSGGGAPNPGSVEGSGSAPTASTPRAPDETQPRRVQVALRQTENDTDSYLRGTPAQPASAVEDRYRRKVVVDAVSCSVTR